MSSPRLATLAILGLSALTAAGLAYQQYRRAEALTAQLAQLQVTPPGLKSERTSRATPSAPETASADEPLTEVEGDFAPPVEADAPPERPGREGGRRERGDMGARFEKLMADPEFAKAFQTQQRAALDGRYADLFKSLNLPPEQLNQLKDLLAEKQNAARDVMMAARAEGMGRENWEDIRDLIGITRAEIDGEIRNLVGEQGIEQINAYEQTGPQRATVSKLETRLSYSGTPLNSAQAEAMVNILAQTSPAPTVRGNAPPGGPSFGGGGNDRTVPITDDTLARAQAVLAPDQLQVLSQLQAEQQASQTINATLRSSFRPGGGEQSTAPPAGGRGPGG